MKHPLTTKNLRTILMLGLGLNVLLMTVKLVFGWLGNANVLVGDGLNSAMDVIISMMILVGLRIIKKRPDSNHHYGHEKYEGVIYFTLGLIFLVSGIGLVVTALQSSIGIIWFDQTKPTPEPITLWVSLGALGVKGILYATMRYLALRTDHRMIKADTHNHLIDIFATSITVIGIFLAQYNAAIFDDFATLLISGFIIYLAWIILRESLGYLTDQAPENEYINRVKSFIGGVAGVMNVDDLKIRKHMTKWYVDVEIAVANTLSLEQAHTIAERVHHQVEKNFSNVIHCMVHVNPINR